ncbi:MAG: hypothetical protein LAP85_16625 [Acidobacteriia bacterium]|nr:hypothetical protein [Terriglobia bacterium]
MSGAPSTLVGVSRPMVKALFIASCLLSIVSWYTTQQGMALYLAPWFALLASLGVQSALVLVAWLVGISKTKRALLIAVYAITAMVSISFSYACLYTWFSARERPATIQRKLYDSLSTASGQAQELVAGAISEGQKHVLALEEMTGAEKAHGYISRAHDSDPYLARIREAVAREAQTYNSSYPEGIGQGLRYTAFDRYAKLARQSLERMQAAQQSLTDFRNNLKPLESTENQLRSFQQVFDAVPWQEVKETLHTQNFALPAVPSYTDFVDRSASGQEDLLIAFQELVSAPGSRHVFAFALAAFIDLIVFLLAYSSGPYFFGAPEERWISAGAVMDSSDDQVFTRNLLRKLIPSPQGMARVDASGLSPGEQQLCLLLVSKGHAAPVHEEGKLFYLLDQAIHEQMVESLANPGLSLRASVKSV